MGEFERSGEVTPLFDAERQVAELIQRRIKAHQEIGKTSVALNLAQTAYNEAIIEVIETNTQLRSFGVDTRELEAMLHQPVTETTYERETG